MSTRRFSRQCKHTADGVSPNSRSVLVKSEREKGRLENTVEVVPIKMPHSPYLGKCCVKVTVSTLTERLCAATNSATSCKADSMYFNLSALTDKCALNVLDSLGRVVVYGAPPLANRICNRVSLKSLPATMLDDDAIAAGDSIPDAAGLSMIGLPSRKAFSRAAFSARTCLSASIWALIAALAFTSSAFSVIHVRTPVYSQGSLVVTSPFLLCFLDHLFGSELFFKLVEILRSKQTVSTLTAARTKRLTLPCFRLSASFAFASLASSWALTARLEAIFSRNSASFACFSCSVSGLI